MSSVLQTSVSHSATSFLLQLLIGGDWVDAASGNTYPVLDPRNEKVIINVASGRPSRDSASCVMS